MNKKQALILFVITYTGLTISIGLFRVCLGGLPFLPPVEFLLARIVTAVVLTYLWGKRIFG